MKENKSAVTGEGDAPRESEIDFTRKAVKAIMKRGKGFRETSADMIARLSDELNTVTAQRDELLVALREIAKEIEYRRMNTQKAEAVTGEGDAPRVTPTNVTYDYVRKLETQRDELLETLLAICNYTEKQLKTVDHPEEPESEQNRDDLIDDGRSDGYGESYAERNA